MVENKGIEITLGKMNTEEKTHLSQIRLIPAKVDAILREQNIEIEFA